MQLWTGHNCRICSLHGGHVFFWGRLTQTDSCKVDSEARLSFRRFTRFTSLAMCSKLLVSKLNFKLYSRCQFHTLYTVIHLFLLFDSSIQYLSFKFSLWKCQLNNVIGLDLKHISPPIQRNLKLFPLSKIRRLGLNIRLCLVLEQFISWWPLHSVFQSQPLSRVLTCLLHFGDK